MKNQGICTITDTALRCIHATIVHNAPAHVRIFTSSFVTITSPQYISEYGGNLDLERPVDGHRYPESMVWVKDCMPSLGDINLT